MRSIFCASPGSQKYERNLRSALSKLMSAKEIESTYTYSTLLLKSAPSPRYSPTATLSSPSVLSRNLAVASGVSSRPQTSRKYLMPVLGFMLNLITPSCTSCLRWNIASKSTAPDSAATIAPPSFASSADASPLASTGAAAAAPSSPETAASGLSSLPSAHSRCHCTIESVMSTSVSSASILSTPSCSVLSVSAWLVAASRERSSHIEV
mmetsp:Transcript_28100/g.71377  ORF Transcript_28100/g.71377 Transcript_28100/m.71377 type:complete len:209 (+) Transcript_28100:1423-2049(+)